jgi:regulator of protease activity HflC (stomatin/prohibitin superfamily)
MSPELLLLLAAAPMLALLLAGVRRVPEGTAFTVHRFGHYTRTLAPGLRFALPLIERVSAPVALINHRIQLPLESSDGAAQRAAFYYQIVEPERSGDQLDDIDNVVEREVRQMLDAVLDSAGRDVDALNGRLKQALNERLGGLGLRVTRCQLGA